MAPTDSLRLFFALWPPAGVAEGLSRLGDAAQRAWAGRRMRQETLHMTLAFLGDVPAARRDDAVAAAMGIAVPAFELSIDRIDAWKRNRIVWAGCSLPSLPLQSLAGQLADRLRARDFVLEHRAFAAHVTLLRNAVMASGVVPPFAALAWPVAEFALVQSVRTGGAARYETLQRWPLA